MIAARVAHACGGRASWSRRARTAAAVVVSAVAVSKCVRPVVCRSPASVGLDGDPDSLGKCWTGCLASLVSDSRIRWRRCVGIATVVDFTQADRAISGPSHMQPSPSAYWWGAASVCAPPDAAVPRWPRRSGSAITRLPLDPARGPALHRPERRIDRCPHRVLRREPRHPTSHSRLGGAPTRHPRRPARPAAASSTAHRTHATASLRHLDFGAAGAVRGGPDGQPIARRLGTGEG